MHSSQVAESKPSELSSAVPHETFGGDSAPDVIETGRALSDPLCITLHPTSRSPLSRWWRSTPLSYRQMAGRAGRKGAGRARGEALLVAANKGQARRAAGLMNAGLAAVKR